MPSPVTSIVRVELPAIVNTARGSPAELLFLYSSLNPVIIPYMEFIGGNCQDAQTLVHVSGVILKLVGAWLGPKPYVKLLVRTRYTTTTN